MLRRLFTIASVLSLLLFVAVVAMWIRSRFVRDMLQDQSHDYFCFMGQWIYESETLGLGTGADTWNNVNYGKGWHWETATASSVLTNPALKTKRSFLGFWYVEAPTFRLVIVPFWSAILGTGILPAVWLRSLLRVHLRAAKD